MKERAPRQDRPAREPRPCHNCGEEGHFARDCPKAPVEEKKEGEEATESKRVYVEDDGKDDQDGVYGEDFAAYEARRAAEKTANKLRAEVAKKEVKEASTAANKTRTTTKVDNLMTANMMHSL